MSLTSVGNFVWGLIVTAILVIAGVMAMGEFSDMINIENTQANQTAVEILNKVWDILGNVPLLLTLAFFGVLIAIVAMYFRGR